MTDKASEKMIADPAKLASFLNEGTNRQDYERNLDLIRLKIVPADEIEFSHPEKDFVCLRSSFSGLRFFSMTNDTAWNKYIETFETIY